MMRTLEPLADRWHRFWFEPAAPRSLAICRIVFYGGLCLYHLGYDYSAWGRYSDVFWMPIWLFKTFHIPQPTTVELAVAQTIWKVALVLAAAGLFTRPAMWVAFVLGGYILGIPHNFGQTQHFDTLIALALGVFAVSRAGDALSFDSLRRAARGEPSRPPSGEYVWPVRAIWVLMSLIFLGAGLSKLRHGGLEWITSDNLALLLIRQQYHISDGEPLTAWGLHVARYRHVASIFAAMAVTIETCYFLALFSRRARAILVPAGLGFLVGIRILMGPTFEQYMLCTLFWVPWDPVVGWMRARIGRRVARRVFFDGACGLCTGTINVLQRLDVLRRIEFHDVARDWDTVAARFPRLDRDECLTDMRVMTVQDGGGERVESGFEGYRSLAWVLPTAWPLLPLLYLPGVPALGRRVYRAVADRRARSVCLLPAAAAAAAEGHPRQGEA